MKKLKLTQEGLEKLTQELESKKEELRELRKYKSQAAANEGDAWHDNFAFEQTEIKERGLIWQINDLQKKIRTAELIQTERDSSDKKVAIGSKVVISLKHSMLETGKVSTFYLTGDFGNRKYDQVSINSPLGEFIIGKEVGFEGKYKVNGNEIFIKILSVSN